MTNKECFLIKLLGCLFSHLISRSKNFFILWLRLKTNVADDLRFISGLDMRRFMGNESFMFPLEACNELLRQIGSGKENLNLQSQARELSHQIRMIQ